MNPDRPISLTNVGIVRIGAGCALQCATDFAINGVRSVLLVTTKPTRMLAEPLLAELAENGLACRVFDDIAGEPTFDDLVAALAVARGVGVDGVIGLGGGSAMDVAKLVAALYAGDQQIGDVVGVDRLAGRPLALACIPTTSGTGSEVTPIAILGDEDADLKKGVVSSHLVPDFAYLDAALTVSMPRAVTASTGIDALTHCIEAFANRVAHPVVDIFASAGMKLIVDNIERACADGTDLEARTQLLLASYYGGLCLGPVNTAAVHALAYPLGGEFHIAHGVANSILLPHVLRFNVAADVDRYAQMAHVLGIVPTGDAAADASAGIELIADISARCGIPAGLSAFGIGPDDVPRMAAAAMSVTRLLANNPREVTDADARAIYYAAL